MSLCARYGPFLTTEDSENCNSETAEGAEAAEDDGTTERRNDGTTETQTAADNFGNPECRLMYRRSFLFSKSRSGRASWHPERPLFHNEFPAEAGFATRIPIGAVRGRLNFSLAVWGSVVL
jgi:hypothetical protein